MSGSKSKVKMLECPLCVFAAGDEYVLLLHIEAAHTEDSPFVVKDDVFNPLDYDLGGVVRGEFAVTGGDAEDHTYVMCPEEECEELVLLLDLQMHVDFHAAEQMTMEDVKRAFGGEEGVRSRSRRRHKKEREGREQREEREQREGPSISLTGGREGGRGQERDRERGRDRDGGGRDRERDGEKERERKKSPGWGKRLESLMGFVDPGFGGSSSSSSSHFHSSRSLSRHPSRHTSRRSGSPLKHQSIPKSSASMPKEPPPSALISTRKPHRAAWSLLSQREERKPGEPSSALARSSSRASSSTSRNIGRSATLTASGGYKYTVKRLGPITKTPPTDAPLQKSDLGPYANEQQMPQWLRHELEKGPKTSFRTRIDPVTGEAYKTVVVSNETSDLIPVLELLCEKDPTVAQVWFCHPGVKHVGKQIRGEGGFCGYRNIQMMISYVQAAFPRGSHPFEGRIPTIIKLQDLIEEGWDQGINPSARVETGGVKGTRKYIGTSEAQTVFFRVGIDCDAKVFPRDENYQTQDDLLAFVEDYFSSGAPTDGPPEKINRTLKAPLYFQHAGHSMTIVGIERSVHGSVNLLVFDPFFRPSRVIKDLVGERRVSRRLDIGLVLKAYRRKLSYLRKYKEFELIM
ncbi:hypothetical protein RUND412_000505 [Rhizina undulata]